MLCINSHIFFFSSLAQLARASFAKLRGDPQLFSTARSPHAALVEDECAVDVPTLFCHVALKDANDLVAAHAYEALAVLCLDSTTDPLTYYLNQVNGSVQSPTERIIIDYHQNTHIVVMAEYTLRLLETVLSKRLRDLTRRATQLMPSTCQLKAFPIIVACMCQMYTNAIAHTNIVNGTALQHDKFAKRWYEMDLVGLVDEFVRGTLLPAITDSPNAPFAFECATHLVRLASTWDSHAWVLEGCLAACHVYLQALESQVDDILAGQSNPCERRANNIALLILAMRSIPVKERVYFTTKAIHHLSFLPWTNVNASTSHLLLPPPSNRTALLAELAVQMFCMDCESPIPLQNVLLSDIVQLHLEDASARIASNEPELMYDTPLFGDELVLVFSHCAAHFGNRLCTRSLPRKESALAWHQRQINHWLRQSLILLQAFAPCLTWNATKHHSTSYERAGESYLSLLGQCLDAVGLLRSFIVADKVPEPSIALVRDYIGLASLMLQHRIPHQVPSLSIQIGLLSILSSHWVAKFNHGSTIATADTPEAKEILQCLGSSLILFMRNPPNDKDDWLMTCITSIELIAATASQHNQAQQLVKLALDILTTRLAAILPPNRHVLQKCSAASQRIERLFGSQHVVDLKPWSIPTWIVAAEGTDDDSSVLSSISARRRSTSAPEGQTRTSPSQVHTLLYWRLVHRVASSRVHLAMVHSEFALKNVAFGMTRNNAMMGVRLINSKPRIDMNPLARETLSLVTIAARMMQTPAPTDQVFALTGSSDPIVATLAYKIEEKPRFDGLRRRCLRLSLRIYNAMAAPISRGLRLDLAISTSDSKTSLDESSPLSTRLRKRLLGTTIPESQPITQDMATHRGEIKSNECITWELYLHNLPTANLDVSATITFRNLKVENPRNVSSWVHGSSKATTDQDDDTDDDDDASSVGADESLADRDEFMDESFHCPSIIIPAYMMLSPCPLVFFGRPSLDSGGDWSMFHLVWGTLQHSSERISLVKRTEASSAFSTLLQKCCMMASTEDNAWACITQSTQRIYCVLSVAKTNEDTTPSLAAFLEIRSDDAQPLASLLCCKEFRNQFVTVLLEGKWEISDSDVDASGDLVEL